MHCLHQRQRLTIGAALGFVVALVGYARLDVEAAGVSETEDEEAGVLRQLILVRRRVRIVCADSVTRGLVRDHPSMNMKIGTLVPGYVLSANLSL